MAGEMHAGWGQGNDRKYKERENNPEPPWEISCWWMRETGGLQHREKWEDSDTPAVYGISAEWTLIEKAPNSKEFRAKVGAMARWLAANGESNPKKQ